MRPTILTTLLLALVCPVLASPVLAKGDRAFGEYLAGECTACHQVSGRATAGIPAIIGYPDDQFIAIMQSYAKKERDNAVMQTVAAKFKDEELAALAAYFGSLKKK
jgi:cytochrome c553